ncbi:MAG: hypothetical protein ACFE95_11270 [Candidatus Hodarchaeota archaeon]
MRNISVEPTCELCGQPLQRETGVDGKLLFICINTKCPAQRLSHIESRLEVIEKLLEISPMVKEKVISVPEKVEVPITPEVELESVIEHIRTLPNLSLEDGIISFYSLIDQLEGSRGKLESLLEETANEEFYSPQFLHQWAILLAYSGKPFVAAQKILEVGGSTEIPLLMKVIDRSNSVREQEKLVSTQFFSNLHNWAKGRGLSETTLDILKNKAGIITPPIGPEKKPKEIVAVPLVPVAREMPPSPSIRPPTEPFVPTPSKSWIDRFRPEEGWEFAIGANWLRWVGIGIILSALFLLVVWSASQLELTTRDIALLAFVGLVLSGVFLHLSSFFLLRFKERSQSIPPIAYSLAFLSLGIYYIAMFALRFHPDSPFSGIENEILYTVLCILLVLISCITAWRHNSSILFIEGYGFVLWMFWHISSQIVVNDLVFSVDILWTGYIVFILAFLTIAYLRKDTVLTISIQLLTLSLLFLPNSSEIFSSHSFIGEFPDINATITLLFISSIVYWIVGFRFPLDVSPQFYEIITRYHLSIASITPVFASFFLLTFGNITGAVLIPYIIIFTTLFLGLAYYQKDLGTAFSLVLLTQFLWLISVGLMDDIVFIESIPEINGVLIVLLFLTFAFWIIASRFPTDDVTPRFWDLIDRKHLSIAAVGPIFVSSILTWFYYLNNTLLVMYMVLFCILWSTDRSYSFDIPSLSLQNASLFDLVTYISVFLFLLTIILQPTDIIGIFLGFIAFPLLLMINQNISRISLQDQEMQEVYGIVNCVLISITFITITMKELWGQLGEHVGLIFPNWNIDTLYLGVQYGHNWAFLGYLWLIIVSLITTVRFHSFITRNSTKLIIFLSSPLTLLIYTTLVRLPEIIALLFILISYGQLLFFFEIFIPKLDSEQQPVGWFLLTGLVVLQIIGFLLQLTTVINLNVLISILINALLPFSLGIFIAFRRRVDYIIDSYLIASIAFITYLQFLVLDSNQLDYAWLIQLAFLSLGLIYIYIRIFFARSQLTSTSTSPSILGSIYSGLTFSHKEEIGSNLLLLCFMGFINTTLCFIIFGVVWSPILVLLTFDSLVVFPLVFALKLCGLKSRLAFVNTLTIYGVGMLFRLPFVRVFEFDYTLFLLILLIIQVIIHVLLIWLNKSEKLLDFTTHTWQFKFKGRETWSQDSYRLMSILNPVLFFLFSSELTGRFISQLDAFETNLIPMIILSVLLAIYFVFTTRLKVPLTISESGLLLSVVVAWFFTFSETNLIYFTTGVTAFLCILYGFWTNRREWRILGLGFIGFSLFFSAIWITSLSSDLERILGFGILGIISVIIGFLYSKFASRFMVKEEKKTSEEGIS